MAIYKNGVKIDRAYKTSTRIDRIYKGSQLVFQNDVVITFYNLTVSGGTGSGKYESGQTVNIVADTAPSGYTFNTWTGETSGIVNVSASTTTLVMPASDVTIGSSYGELFELVVNNGTGGGLYLPNRVVNISADTPPTSYIFDTWTGETTNITDVTASTTTLTMPYEDVVVGSSYRLDPTSFYLVTTKQTNFSLQLYCSTYNTVTIDWRDGTTTLVNSSTVKTHTWATGGSHVVTVIGDLSKITQIFCNTQNLIELNLPDALVNLNTLNCYSNQLTSLILPSGLTTMNYLDCSSNQLTSLILPSGLTTIGTLHCYSNQLTSLILPSGLTSMNTLYCYSNQLTSLILPSGLTTLSTLYCYSNQLTSLTLPSGLTTMNYLYCSSNQLTSLILPSGLTSMNTLQCYSNQLTSLTLPSGLTTMNYLQCNSNQLTSLTLPSGLTTMNTLYCPTNQLTSLILPSGLTTMSNLQCSSNQLTSLTLPSGLTTMSNLYCYSNQLTSLILPSGLTTMNYLDCDSNQLTSLILPSGLTTMNYLNCSSNQLTSLTLPSGLTTMSNLQCSSNGNLTPPDISNLRNVAVLGFQKCGFDQSEVDNMIVQALLISGFDSTCTFEVDNTTTGGVNNATPSATGLANVATLRSRGWTVNHA